MNVAWYRHGEGVGGSEAVSPAEERDGPSGDQSAGLHHV